MKSAPGAVNSPSSAHGGYSVVERPSLAERTSMGVGGEALAEIRVHDPQAFDEACAYARGLGGRMAVLGRGSNLLVREGSLPLVLLKLETAKTPCVISREDRWLFRASADMPLPALLAWAAGQGLSGLEGLSGIPGSLGGAMAMNAGSYGVSMADVVKSAEIYAPETGLTELEAGGFVFSYRNCRPRIEAQWFAVTALTLELEKGEPEAVRKKMAETLARKKATQPVSARSAGCVFKNPESGPPAGRLLEEAGMRGKKIGGMRFSPMHANFLVNEGQGRFEQAEELIGMARDAVRERSGITLDLEVRIWP